MTERPLAEESIFARALEIRSAEERAAFLDRACGGDASLRDGVESLLRADARSGDVLDWPDRTADTTDDPVRERPGTVIGPYKLMEEIGEGGMGLVFVAEQQQPARLRLPGRR